MEQDYVTAAFFRHAIAQRQEHLQQLEDMQQIMDGENVSCLHLHLQRMQSIGLALIIKSRACSMY